MKNNNNDNDFFHMADGAASDISIPEALIEIPDRVKYAAWMEQQLLLQAYWKNPAFGGTGRSIIFITYK